MTNHDLKVALCQADLHWEDCRANLKKFSKKIDAIKTDVDLIVLPEMFASGFTLNPETVAESMNGEAVTWMREQAETNRACIVGSLVIKEDNSYYNRLIWAKPDGSLLHYDKKHLFSLAGEHLKYSPGNEKLIVDIQGWRISSYICFDLRFPVWCRNDKNRPYDIALFVASWPEARSKHWKVLLKARAIENQSYIIGLNRVGKDGNNISYSGDMQIIDALGVVQCHLAYQEATQIWKFSKSSLQAIRENFAFLKEADDFILK